MVRRGARQSNCKQGKGVPVNINIAVNTKALDYAYSKAKDQVPYALSLTLNKIAKTAHTEIQNTMRRIFDRPTPFFINSLRINYASKSKLEASIGYKDRGGASYNDDPIARPHVEGGNRSTKPMERRLQRRGFLPADWQVVPGAGAKLDAYGNMSRGQITQLLNVLGTYTESGYNKANAATRARLARGNKKSYGFVYWINPVGQGRVARLQPGVYQRVNTPFGSSLKPVLIFTRKGVYKKRLEFYQTVQRVVDEQFDPVFTDSFNHALATSLSGVRVEVSQ